jgi:hypothetical protein
MAAGGQFSKHSLTCRDCAHGPRYGRYEHMVIGNIGCRPFGVVSARQGQVPAPRLGQYQPDSFETFVASLAKSVASKFSGDIRPTGWLPPGYLVDAVRPSPKRPGGRRRVPAKRAGTPEEIARTIVFLSSDKASFITGRSIAVDGRKLA